MLCELRVGLSSQYWKNKLKCLDEFESCHFKRKGGVAEVFVCLWFSICILSNKSTSLLHLDLYLSRMEAR